MSRLLIMRHAKSSWSEAGQRDHQRPLNARGRRDAPYMARQVVEAGWTPELAIVSDAARTEETWAWMAETLGTRLVLDNGLYHGTIDDICRAVSEHVDAEQSVLVLGHNPGWEQAVQRFSGRTLTMKTAHIALLEHPDGMAEAIHRRDWSLRGVLTPR